MADIDPTSAEIGGLKVAVENLAEQVATLSKQMAELQGFRRFGTGMVFGLLLLAGAAGSAVRDIFKSWGLGH